MNNNYLLLLTVLTPIAIIVLIVHVLKRAMILSENKENTNFIYLNSSREHKQFFFFAIHFLIEKCIFIRTDSYKNDPRGNTIFIRCLMMITILYATIYCVCSRLILKSQDDNCLQSLTLDKLLVFFGTYVGLVSTLYWAEKSKFKDKWQYLSGLYNQMLLKRHLEQDQPTYILLRNALAIDVVVTMMWGHRSFSSIVKEELERALKVIHSKDAIKYQEKMASHLLTERDALYILEEYQKYLFDKYPIRV